MTPCALWNESCGLRLLAFTGGLRPGLALLLCLGCFEQSLFWASKQCPVRMLGKDKFSLLPPPGLLPATPPGWKEGGNYCYCPVIKALRRAQPPAGSRWEPSSLPPGLEHPPAPGSWDRSAGHTPVVLTEWRPPFWQPCPSPQVSCENGSRASAPCAVARPKQVSPNVRDTLCVSCLSHSLLGCVCLCVQ